MTKTYKGFEALKRMMDGWIQKEDKPFNIYRFEDGIVKAKSLGADCYLDTNININLFFNNTFVDYVEPLVAGDTVKTTIMAGTLYGEVEAVFEEYGTTCFRFKGNKTPYRVDKATRIEKDELAALRRKATFEQSGRMVDEFRKGDIVKFKVAGYEYIAEVMQQGLGKDKMVEFRNAYSGIVPGRDITPVKFATYIDATAPEYVKVDPVAPCTAPMLGAMVTPNNYNVGGRL
ncbi:hypothetical protein HOBO_265 [Bacillus phage Hobo]|uniref:Uncharacterized protein n=2 Tax=Caeruleovirus BM15 TaxID=1985178 RepID=A0A0S2MUZ0_9CAUD|nr:hypothetical protein FD732_gp004 [Bacillus phage BM15]YP_009626818.1 hypothetical protein FD732_gp076 [Bacillus phage BM15]AXQ66786.1 hypothetical protein HOBO_4 [Bacillus phage Hobo]ALO79425.1 hypothetical protein BM10_4 [Bacillus phage BM15]ALO79673.1 hypothetical protein BM10_269 [Bacillus phage BM15]AXQ67020.1 hypothetical protein HOBO_265 [Bacillus phage Hobo]